MAEKLIIEAEHRQRSGLVAESDPKKAGYLKAQIKGRNVFAPFTLVDGMPTRDILDSLVSITDEMKFSAQSAICLSGSITFLGALTSVADLDISEYNFLPPNSWDSCLEALATRPVNYAALARAYVGEAVPDPPFEKALQALRKRSGNRRWSKKEDTVFLEFVVIGAPQSPLAGSNKVLGVLRGQANRGAGSESYVFQEIVISQEDAPPRTLVVPSELGHYLNFLRKEAKEALDRGRPLKAAKRLLALARLVDRKPLGDALVKLLNKYAYVTRDEASGKATALIRLLPKDRRGLLGIDGRAVQRKWRRKSPPGLQEAVREIGERLNEGFLPLPVASKK